MAKLGLTIVLQFNNIKRDILNAGIREKEKVYMPGGSEYKPLDSDSHPQYILFY